MYRHHYEFTMTTRTDFDKYDDQKQLKFRKIVNNFCSILGGKWMWCHGNKKLFSKSNDAWLSGEILLLPQLFANHFHFFPVSSM
ncbi:hypothetical protein TNCV_3046641 [Trichonephila clavipes]|uniref:Uncharacterized protein n=1 Tax=Trichonephila clavipes TaxID=2585209 RepID=A0A8X6RLU0_TRICX|nr:hypothetical protein TNCV_3046641 [Trichonephila clavipes]